jgi:hypothetical protein
MAESEAKIQRDIELALGSLPGVLVLRNSVGVARHVDAKTGVLRMVSYGLGVGSPDLLVVLAPYGRLIGLEVKRPGEFPTMEQTRCHAAWRKFGARVYVVRSVAEAVAYVGATQSEDAA